MQINLKSYGLLIMKMLSKVSSNGILKTVGCGNATITAKSTDDTSITVTANITVKAKSKICRMQKENDRWVKVRAKSQNGGSSFNIRCQKHQTLSPEEPVHILTTINSDVYTARLSAKKTFIISGQEQYTMPMEKVLWSME